jgi:hypothetical protein
MLILGIFLEIIGIIEGILYWRMSEEKYNAKYNETPSEVFKW